MTAAGAAAAFGIAHQQNEALGAVRNVLHDNCGEMFSPTQFGLLGRLARLSATRFGMILPSAKVVDLRVKISAASALAAAERLKSNSAAATVRDAFRHDGFSSNNFAAAKNS
jgi:hypothetical protein